MSGQVARSCTKDTLRVALRQVALARGLADEFLEHRAVGLEAGGVDVGDIVGDHVEFAAQRDLA